jgi:hypothetical protein
MADDYDPFNLRKHPGYYAELVQERDPTQDVAASYVKNHQYDGGILGQLERNPHGLGDSPLPFDPSGAELRSTSEGGSAFAERPKDHMQPVAELISPTLGAFGAGQMAGTAYKEAGEGDYQEAGMSLAPLLAGMVVPGAPKGARGLKSIPREIDARGFYSPSLEAVKGLGQESGTVQQFRSMLLKAGGKPKELDAVGFDKAFPDPNAKVSRQEIEQYLRDNRVQLGRETLGPLESTTNKNSKYNIPQVVRAARESGDTPGDLELTLANDGDAYRALMQRFPELNGNEDWASIVAQDVFGGPDRPSGASKFDSYSTPGGIPGSYREVVTTLPDQAAKSARLKAIDRELEDIAMSRAGRRGQELPERLRDAEADRRLELITERDKLNEPDYTSSHWPDITNPVLHYRQKDFAGTGPVAEALDSIARERFDKPYRDLDASQQRLADEAARGLGWDTGKTRVLDEMQSDWAQSARDQGTKDSAAIEAMKAQWQQTVTDRDSAIGQSADYLKNYLAKHGLPSSVVKGLDSEHAVIRGKVTREQLGLMADAGDTKAAALAAEYDLKANAALDLQRKLTGLEEGVPSAPYISNTSDWVDLGLKQALIDAAKDPSVNRLAWAPGKVQADRYNLAKVASALRYEPKTNTFDAFNSDGHIVHTQTATPEQLPGIVGKDVAKALLAAPATESARGAMRHNLHLSEDMNFGGEGMKSFYGDMTPEGYQSGIVGTRLQKLVKGLDPEAARVNPHAMPDRRSIITQVDDVLATHKVHGQQRRQMADHIADIVEREGPAALDDYAAPPGFEQAWAAAVGAAKKSGGTQYPSIPITPAMREKILKEGLPLFNVAALSALVSRILGQGQPDTEGEDGGGF